MDTHEISPSGHGYTLSASPSLSLSPSRTASSAPCLAPALPSPPKRFSRPSAPVARALFPAPPPEPEARPNAEHEVKPKAEYEADTDYSDGDWDWVQFDKAHELGQPITSAPAPALAPAPAAAAAPAAAHPLACGWRTTRPPTLSPVEEGSSSLARSGGDPDVVPGVYPRRTGRPDRERYFLPCERERDRERERERDRETTITVRDFATPQAPRKTLPLPAASMELPAAPLAPVPLLTPAEPPVPPTRTTAQEAGAEDLFPSRSVWDGGRVHDKPGLQLVMNLVVTCSGVEAPFPQTDGRTKDGVRTEVWPIVGGRWDGVSPTGEVVGGQVVPGGADLPLIRPDGAEVVDAFYRLRADDGTTIVLHNKGLVYPPTNTKTEETYRLQPTFTAPAGGKYAFLNSHLFVATLVDVPPHLARAREGENDRLIQVFCLI